MWLSIMSYVIHHQSDCQAHCHDVMLPIATHHYLLFLSGFQEKTSRQIVSVLLCGFEMNQMWWLVTPFIAAFRRTSHLSFICPTNSQSLKMNRAPIYITLDRWPLCHKEQMAECFKETEKERIGEIIRTQKVEPDIDIETNKWIYRE